MTKKALVWGFWAANLLTICVFWASGNAHIELTGGDGIAIWHAVAKLLGLLATFCALTQFVLMGRAGWLEPIFGLDRLAIFHRRNGVATLALILLHSSSIVLTHSILLGYDVVSGSLVVFGLPFVWMAVLAELLFIVTVGASIVIVRKHLKFETWYAVHVLNYAAIALVPWHQLTNGDDFLANLPFVYYWISLYAFAAFTIIVWRVGAPLWHLWRHRFVIDRVVPETATATSVYIAGKHMEKFRAKGGQFVMVRFFDRRVAWQEHPFSLSMLPDGQRIRLTIRQLGDFTNLVPTLKPGTRVWVSGPYGAFTHGLARTDKVVYIAGGIGITPIRSMIEEKARLGHATDAILLYGNRTEADTALLPELKAFGRELRMPIFNIVSQQPSYQGEKGFIDKDKITRLVPDVDQRDVFLCGPPPMMAGVKKSLKELGVPDAQVHYERFALHKD